MEYFDDVKDSFIIFSSLFNPNLNLSSEIDRKPFHDPINFSSFPGPSLRVYRRQLCVRKVVVWMFRVLVTAPTTTGR